MGSKNGSHPLTAEFYIQHYNKEFYKQAYKNPRTSDAVCFCFQDNVLHQRCAAESDCEMQGHKWLSLAH